MNGVSVTRGQCKSLLTVAHPEKMIFWLVNIFSENLTYGSPFNWTHVSHSKGKKFKVYHMWFPSQETVFDCYKNSMTQVTLLQVA